jgi:hypothetical protein
MPTLTWYLFKKYYEKPPLVMSGGFVVSDKGEGMNVGTVLVLLSPKCFANLFELAVVHVAQFFLRQQRDISWNPGYAKRGDDIAVAISVDVQAAGGLV